MSAFALSVEAFENFHNLPNDSSGNPLVFKYGSFDHSKGAVEVYMQFKEQVYPNKVVEYFEKDMGANQVVATPLPDFVSKKGALESVLKLGAETGVSFSQGEIHKDLKHLLTMPQQQSNAEFDEKTAAAFKASLADFGVKVEQMQGGVAAVDGKMTAVDGKMTAVDGKMDQLIKNQAYLEAKAVRLEREIVEHKLKRDQTERKLGLQTEAKNRAEAAKEEAIKEMKEKEKEMATLLRNKDAELQFRLKAMEDKLECKDKEIAAHLQTIEAKDALISLYDKFEEERALKRTRAD